MASFSNTIPRVEPGASLLLCFTSVTCPNTLVPLGMITSPDFACRSAGTTASTLSPDFALCASTVFWSSAGIMVPAGKRIGSFCWLFWADAAGGCAASCAKTLVHNSTNKIEVVFMITPVLAENSPSSWLCSASHGLVQGHDFMGKKSAKRSSHHLLRERGDRKRRPVRV